MPSRGRIAWFVLAASCFVFPVLHGDWITLKDGIQIHGKIIRENDREVYLLSDRGGMLTFRRAQIEEVHRVSKPKTAASPPPAAAPPPAAEVVVFDSDAPKNVLEKRAFGDATLRLPSEFEVLYPRGRYPGFDGELLGLYQDPYTEAKVTVTEEPIPFKSRDLEECQYRLRRHLTQEAGFEVEVFKSATIGGLPALYTEFREGHLVHAHAWILVGRNRVYSIDVSVVSGYWKNAPETYRNIFQTFRYATDESKAPGVLETGQ